MKNKCLVIQKEGKILEPGAYLRSPDCSEEFGVFIEREALGIGLESKFGLSQKEPEYLYFARKMGFAWEANADLGFMSYDYKANLILRLIKNYARQLVQKIGFPVYEVRGANVFSLSHPVVQAYANLYGDRLFRFKSGKKEVVMSYDASYPQFNLAGQYRLSYKHLPLAHFSISDCYRHEQSGECMLLYRLRRFFMPDLHPYFKDIDEAFAWYPQIEKQLLGAAREVKRDYQVVFEVSSEENWEKYQSKVLALAKSLNQDVLVGILMGKKERYWAINVDYKIIDKLGQSREIACIQVDVGNAPRLGIEYVDKNGKKVNPVIIHSAVPGGIERYLYMIFDNFPESFPLWLYPVQIRLIPVSRKFVPFCQKIIERYKNLPVRIEIDDRSQSVSKRIKLAHKDLVPFPIVVGQKEIDSKKESKELGLVVKKIVLEAKGKPFLDIDYPRLLSLQVR